MKKIYLLLSVSTILLISSCKPALYGGSYGQINQTQVVLSEANFKVLGSFTGSAIAKKSTVSVKDKSGLVASAKADLLETPKIHEFNVETQRVIKVISLTAPSGAANRAVGSNPQYKLLKQQNPKFNTFDFRVLQYKKFF